MKLLLISLFLLNSLTSLHDAQGVINNGPKPPRGRIKIVKLFQQEVPRLQKLCLQVPEEYRDCCIINYSSYNARYEHLQAKLIENLKSHFKGHVLYRVGGWPRLEGGCLCHSDVPYAFKVCAFMEAYEMGYKKVLWLDSLVEPLKDLTPIFDYLEEKGTLFRPSNYPFLDIVTKPILDDFQMTEEEAKACTHISACILGFNFENPQTVELLKEWHASIDRRVSYTTNFPEQIPLSILLHKHALDEDTFGPTLITYGKEAANTFFKIDYDQKRGKKRMDTFREALTSLYLSGLLIP